MIIIKRYILLICIFALSIISCDLAFAEMTIVDNGKSSYAIVVPAQPNQALRAAALELQKDISIATNVTIPIKSDTAKINQPYISLGLTQQAQNIGYNTDDMVDEQCQIITKDGNLYIYGIDTPDGTTTKDGGVSNGTANGVYVFLEKYLDVRWLMPGNIGRDIPHKSTFTLDDIDYSYTPVFHWRKTPYIIRFFTQDSHYGREVHDWANRQRVGTNNWNNSSIRLDLSEFNHNWMRTVPKELYDEHPDWFALNLDSRKPSGQRYLLETTNPELVQYYANKAIETLKHSDRNQVYSLSPADTNSWSESPESKALYDAVSPTNNRPSMSSLVLKFYHDVAQIVQDEYPQGRLAGYIYDSYLWPPQKVKMQLPDNFIPVIAPSPLSYGYKLYNKTNQERYKKVMMDWAKVAPKNWFYYDIPNQFWDHGQPASGEFGGNAALVTPAAPEILNMVFETAVKARITGVRIFNDPAWSNSALANYLVAKMMWDPSLNANALQEEWLSRAYGSKAGQKMQLFYEELNRIFRDSYQGQTYGTRFTQSTLSIYPAHYKEIEELFLEARNQSMTKVQRERLQMIEDNLIVLQWRLRNAGYIKQDYESELSRTDSQVANILAKSHADISYFPGIIRSEIPDLNSYEDKVHTVKLAETVSVSGDADSESPILPNATTFMIYAANNTKVRILPRSVDHSWLFATYVLSGREEGRIASGLLVQGEPIEFDAKKGHLYYLYIPPRSEIQYHFSVENAKVAKSTFDGKSKTLLIKDEKAPFYIIAGTNNNIASMEGGVLFGSHTQESIYLDWIKQNRLTNLIQNPSLENTMESNANHPTGWSTYSRRGRVQFSMVKGKEGNGVRINNTIHGDRGTVQQYVPVKAGETYVGTVWVKAAQGSPNSMASLSLRYRTDNGWYDGHVSVDKAMYAKDDWQQIVVVAKVPLGSSAVSVMLWGNANGNSDVIFDNAALYHIPPEVVGGE